MEKTSSLCCRKFRLEFPYEYIKKKYHQWLENGKRGSIQDIELIYPMLIPLDSPPTGPTDTYGNTEARDGSGRKYEQDFYFYTCKHFINDNCTIYEDRPNVCRIFGSFECKMEGHSEKCSTRFTCSAWTRQTKPVEKVDDEEEEKVFKKD